MASKRLKLSEDEDKRSYNNGEYETDRLTSLPDPLIHHIFSFLPTLVVVQTSLCIKSLQHIWRSIPSLDFSDTDFEGDYDCNYVDCSPFNHHFDYDEKRSRSGYHFNIYGFLNTYIRRRDNSEIEKLRIRCGNLGLHDIDAVTKINECIITAMRRCRRIRVLDFGVSDSYPFALTYPFKITRRILTCSSLRELKLCLSGFKINFPTSVCLPLLKKLHLKHVKYCNHHENEAIFSQSPLLEILIIEYCWFNKVKPLTISANQLKHLTIMGILPDNTTFATPNLVSLKLRFNPSLDLGKNLLDSSLFFVDKLDYLAEADIDGPIQILRKSNNCSLIVVTECSIRMIRALQNVHSLTLSRFFIESYAYLLKDRMYMLDHIRIPFYNLKSLKVETFFYDSPILVINTILYHSPNIETLVLSQTSKKSPRYFLEGTEYDTEELGFDYQLMHLKSACFQNINLSGCNEIMFMSHLLKNSVALQKFVLVDPRNRANFNKGNIEEMLLKLPPASQTVQIFVE